ncbi:hypothetical protein BDV98DRAFT_582187 [Pterulicium gracile]|uniref:Uncharacterized protein n=1 Tax=Pterulicium gracile TaxID=1884261 RepID=A0A5C3QMN7_9AGAR|nr:hypothetical protein BDV98DRAFT_582187 [Pterula gracilis]
MDEHGSDAEMSPRSIRKPGPREAQAPILVPRFQDYATKTAREIDRDLLLGLVNTQMFKDEFTWVAQSSANSSLRARIDTLARPFSNRSTSSILGTVLTIINRLSLLTTDRAIRHRHASASSAAAAYAIPGAILSPLMDDVSGLPSVPPTPMGTPQSSAMPMTGLPFTPSSPGPVTLSPFSDPMPGLPSLPNTPQPASWTLQFEPPPPNPKLRSRSTSIIPQV